MASSVLACNPWYHFALSFSWSNDCVAAQLLSDIPFISVGTLVFAVSPLFLSIRRLSLSTIWLLFSSLLAFVAAVLDLGQTLADGMAMSMAIVSNEAPLRAREVLLALSLAFRFLFYWSYVAEPPRKVLTTASTQRCLKFRFLTIEYTYKPHTGSWARWGLPGRLLCLGLLAAIMTITALQLTWRVVPRFHQYSNVYATDTALELVVSFLLLLKLLSNTLNFNSPDNMPVHTFRECLAPISGLLVGIAAGVGNLLSFAFTEATVGRLLQALEVYIIVIFIMVIAFLKHCDLLLSIVSSQRKKRKDVMFTLPIPVRGSTFRITPPLIETPRMSMVLGSASSNQHPSREGFPISARRSLNGVSSWLSSKVSRNRPHYEDDEAKLWKADKIQVDPPYTRNTDTGLRSSIMSSTGEPKEWTEYVHDESTNRMSILSALDAQSAGARSLENAIQGGPTLHLPPVDYNPQHTDLVQAQTDFIHVSPAPLPPSFRMKHMESAPDASPVYGLGGSESFASTSDSRTSLDELLRQQSQLDQSIEALRLFSNSSCSNFALSKSAELSRTPSAGQRTVSSDVSLSSFPIPPWLTTPVPPLPASRPSSFSRIRGGKRVRLAVAQPMLVQDADAAIFPKASASLNDIPRSPRFDSIPSSPLGPENESISAEARNHSSSDSGAIQYNVTSFIGGLVRPGVSSQEMSNGSNVSLISQTSHIAGMEQPRMMSTPPLLGGLPAFPAVSKRSPLRFTSRGGS